LGQKRPYRKKPRKGIVEGKKKYTDCPLTLDRKEEKTKTKTNFKGDKRAQKRVLPNPL
jgi:hypothetical protein